MNAATHLTPFDIYCDSLEELPAKLDEAVGYKVQPKDIWSLNITPVELKRLHVVLTIIYWDKTIDKLK